MIITQVIGGLGNQMFQYAAARALALRRGDDLRLDLSAFEHYALHHGYELGRVFGMSTPAATAVDRQSVLGWQACPFTRRLLSRKSLSFLRKAAFAVEPHFAYWGGIDKTPSNVYLQGYWQSYKYFEDTEAVIRKDFTFRPPMLGYNAEIAEKMDETDAISLHVRRGDYVSDAKTAATHGTCGQDYYRAAIGTLAPHLAKPHLFVFSDDVEWVRCNFTFGYPSTFIGHNQGAESFRDMRLMSLCNHHIIANSSFSWWGAWLSVKPGKKVVAPQRWFVDGRATDDLIPLDWIRL